MKDLLLYMAKSLVDNPDSVTVTEVEGETTVLELRVAPEDMGKLIGRQGRIAKEIRTIIKSVAQRTGQKVSVEIANPLYGDRPYLRREILPTLATTVQRNIRRGIENVSLYELGHVYLWDPNAPAIPALPGGAVSYTHLTLPTT